MSSSSWALRDRHSLTYKQSQMTKGLFPNTSFINPSSSPVLKNQNIKHTFLINKHLESEEGFCEWQLLILKINNSATKQVVGSKLNTNGPQETQGMHVSIILLVLMLIKSVNLHQLNVRYSQIQRGRAFLPVLMEPASPRSCLLLHFTYVNNHVGQGTKVEIFSTM